MIRTNKCKCKCSRVELEKEDENMDYGNYYYADDGERRQDVMEVSFDIIFLLIFLGRGGGHLLFNLLCMTIF